MNNQERRSLSAARREAATARRLLAEALALAVERRLADSDDPLAYRLTELLGAEQHRRRPNGAAG